MNKLKFSTFSSFLKPLKKFVPFIGPNPKTSFNSKKIYPCVDSTAFIGPFSTVIGDVTIKENVFVAPNVSIRADEGTPFFIGANTNIQDGVILHGLKDGRVTVSNKKYSIYISEGVSCTHGCIIHGPCKLGSNVFIGFNAIVFNATIGSGSYISVNALITGGVRIASNRFVPAGAIIDTQHKADTLERILKTQEEFIREVQHVNKEFPAAYSTLFGSSRCTCGLECDPKTLKNFKA